MKYVLITPNGKQFTFCLKSCAEIYRLVWGGEVHEIVI